MFSNSKAEATISDKLKSINYLLNKFYCPKITQTK